MSKWIPAWRYVPIDYNQDVGVFEDITQKCVFTNNLNGSKIRIRFNNLYRDEEMHIQHVAVTLRNRNTGKSSRRIPVTLNGCEQICIPANSEVYSDEISLSVTWEDDFLVNMYFKEKTVIRSVCTISTGYSWQSSHHTGNFHETDSLGFTFKPKLVPALANDPSPLQFVVGIDEIAVFNEDGAQLIGMFGDSITHMSYVTDPFLTMLYQRFPGKYSVINGGISGNRIQKKYPLCIGFPGEGHQFGIAGTDRFLQDMYNGACPDIVFIMQGVNDCSHSLVFNEPDVPTAQDIYAALRSVITMAQEKGSKAYVTTITPFGAFGDPWRPATEALRCSYNDLIREGKDANDWVDLDAVMRDPEDPHRMQDGMHMGDGVHPNWAGGTKMAKAIFNKWFQE
jgi:lysophospholipase L1-like esterase